MPDPEVTPRIGRFGSRWINIEPSGDELADWFTTNVKLHEGLRHEDYIAGITLIQQTSKNKHALLGLTDDGQPILGEREDVIYTPYPRVDARVAYFWHYLELHPRWTGKIQSSGTFGDATFGTEGYFRFTVPVERNGDKRDVPMIGRSMRVRILDRGEDVHEFPSEAKTVPMVGRYGDLDEHAMARASTGAIGRALGVAGMLVLPGTGIASAEDVQEAIASAGLADAAGRELRPASSFVPAEISPEDQRARLLTLMLQLRASDQQEAFTDWWAQRSFPAVAALDDGQVKIALQKAEQLAPNAVPTET